MPTPISPKFGPDRQQEIYVRGVAGIRPTVPTDPTALEHGARERMSEAAYAYIAGGAGTESTMRANREAFERWRIVPRILRDVSQRDLSVPLFGHTLGAPLLLAPIGVLEMAHRRADLAVARAAAAEGVPFVFSNQASVDMETCAAAMATAPHWFQLYWSQSDRLVESFVRRAEACGCSAIVLTLDTTMLGWRPRDLNLGSLPFLHGMGIAQYVTDPVFRRELQTPVEGVEPAKPPLRPATLAAFVRMMRRYPGTLPEKLRSGAPRAAVQRFIATYSRPSLGWQHLRRLRDLTKLPIVLKGVLHPEDARTAVETGVDGIIVSNHGGRQVDGAIASLDALPPIVEIVKGKVPVLLDSGIRSGADVFKALALGARAVLIGRPYAYGLALAGEAGVREVLRNVRAEFDLTMGLAGCRRLSDIKRECLARGVER